MLKLQRRNNKIDIEVVGDFTPKPVPISSYESYVKAEERKQLKTEILAFLDEISPKPDYGIGHNYSYEAGKIAMKDELAQYLVDKVEDVV